jgi:hypothetical protein
MARLNSRLSERVSSASPPESSLLSGLYHGKDASRFFSIRFSSRASDWGLGYCSLIPASSLALRLVNVSLNVKLTYHDEIRSMVWFPT